MADFRRAFALVILAEGDKFTNDPQDNGGPTKYGVTQKTLSDFLGRQATVDDVRNLTSDVANQIYKTKFWDKINGDALPWAYALLCFDAAINSGVSRAASWLQLAVGTMQDGIIGQGTLNAVGKANQADAIPKMVTARLKFMSEHEDFSRFGNGWYRRVILKVMQAVL